ncbi:hypothetical protein Tco_0697268 [Tanacetum coccineum]
MRSYLNHWITFAISKRRKGVIVNIGNLRGKAVPIENIPTYKLQHLKTAILNILHLAPNSLSDIVCYVFERPINRSIWSIMQRLVIGVVVYFVWQVQNLRIFQMQSRSISELCGIIRQNVRLILSSLKIRSSRQAKEDAGQLA